MSAPSNSVVANAQPASRALVTPRQLTLVFVVALAIAWGFLPEFTVSVLSNIGLYALVAAGLVMLTGVGGMTSFGQAAFVGMGSYATAWLCTSPLVAAWLGGFASPALLPWAGLLLGLVFTFALAWALGAVTVKLSGHYLPLCTIAWGLSLYFLFGNMEFLGGQTGITGVPPLVIAGFSLATPRALGVLIWAVLLLALWALHNLLDSREGRAIRALKGGRLMAESMGVDTARHRIKLFVLAALLAAVSGWLYAHLQRFVNPTPFNLNIGIELLFMAVVGGAGHLWGAVLGAALITLLKEKLQDVLPSLLGSSGNFEVIVFGLLMLFVLQRFADGLWPTLARITSRWVRADAASSFTPKAGTAVLKLAERPLPPAGELLLAATDVSKRFGGLIANNAISMTLKAGEIHALIGPNGAGKSTFFNMLSGAFAPSDGRIIFMGRDVTGMRPHEFAHTGIAKSFQITNLFPNFTALENVRIALQAHVSRYGLWRRRSALHGLSEQAAAVLKTVGLAERSHHLARELAHGQQRALEIGVALAGRPKLLLMDEPTAGMSPEETKVMMALIRKLVEERTVVLVEHKMKMVMGISDRIVVLHHGELIAEGTPDDIRANDLVKRVYLGQGNH